MTNLENSSSLEVEINWVSYVELSLDRMIIYDLHGADCMVEIASKVSVRPWSFGGRVCLHDGLQPASAPQKYTVHG